tara:strand:+ start:387 stop:689 length:303 start_codon:yes stop_codon:yes gene_type:complete
MKKVWSINIKGKNDQVIMDDAEAMIVKMKFMPDIEMFDLTTLHNILPEHLHKVSRSESLDNDIHLQWIKNALEMGTLGGYPSNQVKENWEYQDLVDMPIG